jgi:hypothetical protein
MLKETGAGVEIRGWDDRSSEFTYSKWRIDAFLVLLVTLIVIQAKISTKK